MDSELGSDDDHSGLEPSLGELSDDEEEAVAQPQPDIRQPTQRRSRAIRMLSFVFGQLPEEEAGVSVGSGLLESDGGGMHDSSSSDQEDEREGGVSFDRSRPAAHTYLGDREDLEGIAPQLEDGVVTLPLLRVQDFVLFPGQTLPLRVHDQEQRGVVRAAMEAEFPLKRLLTVATTFPAAGPGLRGFRMHRMACTAELRQMRREEYGDCISCVVVGRQRAVIDHSTLSSISSLSLVPVSVCKDIPSRRLPAAVMNNMMYWGRWAYKPFDAYFLAEQAIKLVVHVCPKIKTFHGTPLELSYWLAAHLPFDMNSRRKLLAIDNEIDRLKEEISLIHVHSLAFMRCVLCRSKIANSKDIIEMCDAGPGAAFVNSYGAVHGLTTLSSVERQGIELIGQPETEFSWFPGYAWTIMECGTCGKHLGWRFTATRDDLRPKTFWGLSLASVHS